MDKPGSLFLKLLAVLMAAVLLSGCAAQVFVHGSQRALATMTAAAPKPHAMQPGAAGQVSGATANQAQAAPVQAGASADVSYRLQTGMSRDGRMAFIGVGGDIDGQANPQLHAKAGQVIEVVLTNGDNILHNITLPDFDQVSRDVTKLGDETRLMFQVTKDGTFEYFCGVPGHKQAGMLGKLMIAPGEGGQAAAQPAPEAGHASAAPTEALAPVDTAALPSIVRAPDDLPGPLTRTTPETVQVTLETSEVTARLADGVSYTFWTFNGKLPGPFIRAQVGDTIEVTLRNAANSSMAHSVDFHAATGPGGGAVATQTRPGEETHVTFKALNPGLYVYHCATPSVAQHISNGMYGLILVEPEGGLPPVDHEFYVMQGELFTHQPFGQAGAATFDYDKLLAERPEYFVFNGAVGSLTDQAPLKANVGETVRIFFGVGGPNATSSFHIIGEIFDQVFDQASLTAAPLTDVQTTLVPPGGATMVEFQVQVPGRYLLVDHALSRLERGLVGYLLVDGPENKEIFDGVAVPGSGH